MLFYVRKIVYTEEFWSHQYEGECVKWLLRLWGVTPQNGVKETIYIPRDKLYYWE